MRLGLIARADSRGLGIQTKAVYDNLHPAKTLVVDCPSVKPLPVRRDWYPDGQWIHGLPSSHDFRSFLDGVDVVYTAETAYGAHFWDEAERAGVKTVLHANFEFLRRTDRPTLWAAPSLWRIGEWPTGTQFLPVPISVQSPSVFSESEQRKGLNVLHVVGRPAVHDRNGTADLLQALQYVTAQVTVSIRCQEPGYVSGLVAEHNIRTPNNVTLRVESGDAASNLDLYRGQDVLVMPRRFGGLCLPANEALGHGMPVIMPRIDPNTKWLPGEWLTPAMRKTRFNAPGGTVEVFQTDPQELATQIDRFATDTEFYLKAQQKAQELADSLSWESLRGTYIRTLEGL